MRRESSVPSHAVNWLTNMDNNSIILLVIIIALGVYFRKNAKQNEKEEDDFIDSIDRNTRIAPPKVKNPDGTKKSPEQLNEEWGDYYVSQRQLSIKLALAGKIQAQRIGSKEFFWRSADDGDTCPECQKNDGKKFRWDNPPKAGLPGVGNCCPDGQCRCYAEAIIPPSPKR